MFFSVYTIQAWINYKSIQDSITQAKQDIVNIENEIAFMEKRYKNYLESDYASYFLGHENGQLYPGERLVTLEYRKPEVFEKLPDVVVEDDGTVQLHTPEESWQFFIQEKLKPLKHLWIVQ